MTENQRLQYKTVALDLALVYHGNREGNPDDIVETAQTFLDWIMDVVYD